ncbi:Glutamate receptor ionotropic, kainate 2-like 4 [Homarus americanus]|uniref:Glutamate receptor ionotropic, kainate 2-like 4 n=1 Tax=Homarus americanus TaxID=6706 RepID=A0A8J5JPH5_HOMAM|nr:Glutamate receptor ionotropic, kainate 2-like 4 [Homarus americanus]
MNGLYAYLMESTSIEYVIERNCDLTQVGGLLDSKSYGIALPSGESVPSPSLHTNGSIPRRVFLKLSRGEYDLLEFYGANGDLAISSAILALQETSIIQVQKLKWWSQKGGAGKCLSDKEAGIFYTLKEKWFKQKRGGGKCKEEAGGSSMASELNLSNVGGVFVVLLGGMGLALIVAMGEFVLECWGIAKEDEEPMMDVLNKELRFVFKCKGSSKPVRKKASESEVGDASNNLFGSDVYNYSGKNPLS